MTALRTIRRPSTLVALLSFALAGAACSGNTTDDDTDVTERDGGPRDAGPPPDGGVLATCTVPENNPDCTFASDCSDGRAPSADCPDCPDDHDGLCFTGQCVMPTPVPSGNSYVFNVGTTGFEAEVQSLMTLVVDREPAGGLTISCADVPGTISWDDWKNPCYNLLRTKYVRTDAQQTYRISMSGFASERSVLFIAYGFEELSITNGLQPIGVTCTEWEVGVADPNGGLVQVPGNNLQRIQ